MKEPPNILVKILILALSVAFWMFIGIGIYKGHKNPIREDSGASGVKLEECFISQFQYNPLTTKLWKIIQCESGGRNICNKKGCQYGQGLAMIIPKTERYCEEKLGRELDMLDPDDNWDCAFYLLENEGDYHWGTPESNWGTYYCWSE